MRNPTVYSTPGVVNGIPSRVQHSRISCGHPRREISVASLILALDANGMNQQPMVGASRFERPTSRTPSECANQAALRPEHWILPENPPCAHNYFKSATIASSSSRISPSIFLVSRVDAVGFSPEDPAFSRCRAPSMV